MPSYAFRIVNVFAEEPLAGNPLAVFEDARGMDDSTMQAIALQFNLSETTSYCRPIAHGARAYLHTTFEMPLRPPHLGRARGSRDARLATPS